MVFIHSISNRINSFIGIDRLYYKALSQEKIKLK